MDKTDFNDFNNAQVTALPAHLKQYIVPQHYEHYTPIDQAVWRYVMRQNYHHLKDIAYYPYIPGLKAAGLTIESIPDLQQMNDALGRIGWGAVTVDGFIPPAAFMEYQAYRVLVIAADIRQLEHIEYTPAPDIIHESAGHAPIIAEEDYHKYLSYFGSIGAKALYSAQDYALYEAIRALSILKEMPHPDIQKLKEAEERLAWQQANMGEPSEMALLSRLHWWTVEYGLIGTLNDPKIYGAGLLSSIGESAGCMLPQVKKLPYSLNAVDYSYDITQPQPQLFVTPDFKTLIDVLETFADGMAFRRGGVYGLEKAVASQNVCTAVYSSGLQVSGIFTGVEIISGHPVYLKTTGATALAFDNKQLDGHGKTYHADGFGSPIGPLAGRSKALEDMTPQELASLGLEQGMEINLRFESGITVAGNVLSLTWQGDRLLLVSFSCCTVTDVNGELLFDPAWGVYDMAVGHRIVSVFSGAADKDAYEPLAYKPATQTWHPEYTTQQLNLQDIYRQVRNCRQCGFEPDDLQGLWARLLQCDVHDWLCAMEILELVKTKTPMPTLEQELYAHLKQLQQNHPQLNHLIEKGLKITHLA